MRNPTLIVTILLSAVLVTGAVAPTFAQASDQARPAGAQTYMEHILPRIEQDRRARAAEQREVIQSIFIPGGLFFLAIGVWILLKPAFWMRLQILGHRLEGVKPEVTPLTWIGLRMTGVLIACVGVASLAFAVAQGF
jgi:hypothetical protein